MKQSMSVNTALAATSTERSAFPNRLMKMETDEPPPEERAECHAAASAIAILDNRKPNNHETFIYFLAPPLAMC